MQFAAILGTCRSRLHLFADPHAQHFSLVCFQYLEAMPFQVDLVARRGNFSGSVAEQSGQRGYRFIGLVAELYAEQLFHGSNRHAAAHDQAAIRFTHHVRRRRFPVVSAFAYDFFHQVFDSGDARNGPVLVNHHGERLALLPHFAQQLRTGLRFGNEQRRFRQLPHFALRQILIRNVQKILRVDDAENIVQRFFVDRYFVKFRLHNFGVQFFECGVRRYRHDVRPRRHYFPHAFVAEFHHLLDQLRLLWLDDAFFFRGFHQRFDSLFRTLLLRLFQFVFGDARERFRAFEKDAHRPDEPHRAANQRQQRQQPSPRGPVEQHVGNEVHGEDHFEHDEDRDLHKGFPGAMNEVHDAPRRFQYEKRKPEVAEDAERAPAALAPDFQLRFDFRLEDVQVFVNAPGGHAAKFAVDQSEVGKDGQRQSHQDDTQRVEPAPAHHANPNRLSSFRSMRSISPRSVSW